MRVTGSATLDVLSRDQAGLRRGAGADGADRPLSPRDWLEDYGYRVNRKKVQRLMRTKDLVAQYPKRNLSLANQTHEVYPYLLRGLVIDRPNQVWATDITYIPMARALS